MQVKGIGDLLSQVGVWDYRGGRGNEEEHNGDANDPYFAGCVDMRNPGLGCPSSHQGYGGQTRSPLG